MSGFNKSDLQFLYNEEIVLKNIQCYKDNESYDSYRVMLNEVFDTYKDSFDLQAYVTKDDSSVYVIVTLGKKIEQVITKLFDRYDYINAMLLNSLSDQLLFNASEELYPFIKDFAGSNISSRKEPGHAGIDVEVQKKILYHIKKEFDIDMNITGAYMLDYSKSISYYYELLDGEVDCYIDHDCMLCSDETCSDRHYQVVVHDEEVKQYKVYANTNLLDVLRSNGYGIESPCSGKMLCGKCKVQVKNHSLLLTNEEQSFLTKKELDHDYILSCFHTVDTHLDVYIDSKKEASINTDIMIDDQITTKSGYGIAIDIGTTSIVIVLVDIKTGVVLDTIKDFNPQRTYGADVISRINYDSEHRGVLNQVVNDYLEHSVQTLLQQNKLDSEEICNIVVSGNTTMIYLLLGIDPISLGVAPFTTKSQEELNGIVNEFTICDINVEILPYISAYIGGDIISGIYALNLLEEDGNILFIDIGTNGELALKTKDILHCISTAAGPAFEGSNLYSGMPSIEGAIYSYENKKYEVIGNKEASGICGTGVIDTLAYLLNTSLVDNTGYMENPYIITKDIGIYPDDVRQVQLAKAAIYAGIQSICELEGLSFDEIDTCYIAGGFGSRLNIDHAIKIGLLPSELKDKVKLVGNTSLSGAIKYVRREEKDKINTIIKNAYYTELSSSELFYNYYINAMMFGESDG